MIRRDVIKTLLATTLPAAVGVRAATDGQALTSDKTAKGAIAGGGAGGMEGIIDVHAHVVPGDYVAFLKNQGVQLPGLPPPPPGAPPLRPMLPPGDSPEAIAARLQAMDQAGVAMQILSPTITPFFQDETLALQATRIANEAMLTIAEKAPERFKVFAVLPIPHIEAAKKEMHKMLKHPQVAGVALSCFYGERSVADAYFEPLYAALNKKRAILFLHPAVNGLCSPFITNWKLSGAAGATFEDAVIAMHLMISGIPSRYPDIQIIVPHLGGPLPTLVSRLDNQLPIFSPLSELPSVTAKRLWYDTCCHGSLPALRSAIEVFGEERILPGSDYPFLTLHEPYDDTFSFIQKAGLPGSTVNRILQGNACQLFHAEENHLSGNKKA